VRALVLDPKNAAAHNTLGLVEARFKSFGTAARAFEQARTLDPSFFEAHMNAAALSLRIGAFALAEAAYRDALRVRAGDYDARLGLALAVRAQIDAAPDTLEARLSEASKLL